MNKKHKLIFSIIMIFVLCISLSAISAADDDNAKIADSQNDDAKIAESQDYDAISASDVENIEIETADNDVGELSSPAESEILSDAIDTSTATVKVVNGTKNRNGEVLLDFSEICYDIYDTPISSEDTYLTINGETINGYIIENYHWDYGVWYFFNMPELEEGEYPFTIHYGGNEFFTDNDFSGTYYVTKIPLHVGIYPNSVKEGNDGTIEVWIYDDVYYDDSWLSYSIQDATLIVNGKEYKFDVQGSDYIDEGTLITIDSLPAGNYDVSFRFAGDDNYMAVEEFVADKQFSVISKDNKANINDIYTSVTDAYIGNNLTITYEIDGKVEGIEMDGKFKIILVDENENEYEYIADVDEYGEGSIDLGWNLTGGTYIFKVQYMGNDYYNPSELVEDQYGEPMTLTIYDENNKKIIESISLYYCYSILKGENTTFDVYIDEYYQISDIPFTGTVKVILRNAYDESDMIEYLVTLDEYGQGSINLGYNLTGTNYNVDVEYLNDPIYSYENEYSYYNLEIYSEENKAYISWYNTYINVTSAFKNHNGTVTLDFTDAKKGNIPLDGTVTIQLREANGEESFEYVLDIIDDIATVDLGYNFNYNEYYIIPKQLNSKYYYTDNEIFDTSVFHIYDEEHKASVGDIYSEYNDTFEGKNATINIYMPNSKISDMPLTGNLKLILSDASGNGNKYEYMVAIDENGRGSIDLGYNLTHGTYDLSAMYRGNDYYKADDGYTWLGFLTIYGGDYKADISSFLNYSFENITKGENATITLDLSPYQVSGTSMAGTMNITLINCDSYEEYYYLNDYVVDDSGKCIAKLGDNLPLGKYYFLLSYSGNDFYNDNEFILYKKVYFQYDDYIDWDSEEVYIYVVEKTIDPKAATSLTASNVNINANPNSGYFKVTLKSNGAALAGQNVTITFNGKSYTALTDKNGVASFKLSSGIAKKYPVAISFKGNDKYLGSTANAYVTIKKNKVKFVSPTKKVKKSKAKKAKFKITLKTSNNKVLAKKRVYIKINKKTYKAKTNAKGVATFKLKLPKKKKTYKYKVTFKGDKANNKKTFSKKLKVK